MRILSNWLNRVSDGRVALAALLIFALFIAFVLPAQPEITSPDGTSAGSPDLSFWYSPDSLYEIAEAYGPTGRAQYIRARATFDVAWPLVYVAFLATSLSWVFRAMQRDRGVWRRANLIPVAAGLLDLLENVSTSIVMLRFPAHTSGLDLLAPVFTMAKWVTLSAGFLTLFAGLTLVILFRLRGPKAPVEFASKDTPQR